MSEKIEPQWQALRFCSRCGGSLSERTVAGRLRPACSACGFVVYIDPKVACAVLVEHEGCVLLVKRRYKPGQGLWCLPAGFAEADEPPEEAAAREAQEEAGIVVTLEGLVGAYHYTDDPRGAGILLVYRAHSDDCNTIRAGDDAEEVGFFAPEALPPISHHTHRRALDEWLQARTKL